MKTLNITFLFATILLVSCKGKDHQENSISKTSSQITPNKKEEVKYPLQIRPYGFDLSSTSIDYLKKKKDDC